MLAEHSKICAAHSEIKIHRKVTEILAVSAERGSLVVVGEPGAGKSGALHDFVEQLEKDGREFLFIAVDRLSLAAGSLGQLRTDLGLDHELLEVLRNWHSERPPLLIIDSLDAARGEAAGNVLRDLIGYVSGQLPKWHVVASVREFDLRYSTD